VKLNFNPVRVNLLLTFITNRYQVYENRRKGRPKPWTIDGILRRYRFCNVHRENDTVTRWIADNWRDPNTNDPHVWFAMLVARYVNEPATLELIGYPVPYVSRNWLDAVATRQKQKANVFNAAYIIPTGGIMNTGPKHETLDRMFTNLWLRRNEFVPDVIFNKPLIGALAHYSRLLTAQPGIGTFMAGQIMADLKYTEPYIGCDDWWTFAVSGPGSRRGLNRVIGRDVKTRWKEDEWFIELNSLRDRINIELKRSKIPILHGQDMQNCLCEFDKYCRVYYGEAGRPKQLYDGDAK
jgi:hypothetical protein